MEIGGRFAGSRFADGGRFAPRGGVSAVLSITSLANGTAEIETTETSVTITISGSDGGVYDGAYAVTVADLAAGPVYIIAPVISGTPGGTLAKALAGVAVYDADHPVPVITGIWQADGVDLAGQTGDTLISAALNDVDVTYRETATQSGTGARSVDSNAIVIPAAPALHSHTATFDQDNGTILQEEAEFTGDGTNPSLITADSGAAGFQTAGNYSGQIRYTAQALNDDQKVEFGAAQFGVTTAGNIQMQGMVRATGASDGYRLAIYFRNGQAPIMRMYKGGSFWVGQIGGAIAVGDDFRLSAVDDTISVDRRPSGGAWASVWSVTDTDYTSGSPGIYLDCNDTATVPLFEYATFAELA